ncbi:hypothetical protein [Alteromonas sp. ASW11-130]|uniref:hypothetical protein n=1 Tax=Alteromonas sp. ASW11-130 TaxID=3015775 RepID=UPI0022424CF0|nr:hypothetical protein [Alteromonas sp. ASW11-130]MCW8091296.1 hypothetical protein [Alteromonas sp. ASW11-130]
MSTSVSLLCLSFSASAIEICESAAPLASWDFNAGEDPANGSGIVEWRGDHGGVQSIPGKDLQGISFHFRGKDPAKDSTSEWRYSIKKPLSHTWEYLRFLQPDNFYHRANVRIDAGEVLDTSIWQKGHTIKNDKGMEATVAYVDANYLYIENFDLPFSKDWGDKRFITNKSNGAEFASKGSRSLGYNNKFSTQWQGKYSNGGLTLESQAQMPGKGGEIGVSYFRPTVNSSISHKGYGSVGNDFFSGSFAESFNPVNNGKIIEFVVERKRSSSLTARDGGYRIWRKIEGGDWELIFMSMQNLSYVEGANYFDNGYVLGWANSGYEEDTTFWLLGWQLWDQKPSFLK